MRFTENRPGLHAQPKVITHNKAGTYFSHIRADLKKPSSLLILGLSFMVQSHAMAFGANEIELCSDISSTLSISTYTEKLNSYLTTRSGAVPAWLAAKSAKAVLGKSKTISGIDGAATELKDLCDIAATGDDLVRNTKILAKIAGKTGPIGSYIEAQMGAGLIALQEGSRLISDENTLGQASRSQVVFNIRLYAPRWYWSDKMLDRAETLNTVRSVQVYAKSNGEAQSAQGALSDKDDCTGKKAACYVANFDYGDTAASAYAIRIELNNGQVVYASTSQLQTISGEPVKTLGITASLGKGGATLFAPR